MKMLFLVIVTSVYPVSSLISRIAASSGVSPSSIPPNTNDLHILFGESTHKYVLSFSFFITAITLLLNFVSISGLSVCSPVPLKYGATTCLYCKLYFFANSKCSGMCAGTNKVAVFCKLLSSSIII